MKAYVADYDRLKPRFERGDTLGQMGYTIGEATIHVLTTMKEPTRQAMMDTARNMNGVTASLLLPGITMTTKSGFDGFPIESMKLFRFNGDKYEPIGSVIPYEGRTPKIELKESRACGMRPSSICGIDNCVIGILLPSRIEPQDWFVRK